MKKNQTAIVSAADIESEKKENYLSFLNDCLGLKNLALEKTGISSCELDTWLDNDEQFARRVHEAKEYAGDQVEGMLFRKIQDGDTTAIMFYCETKLKARGYYKKS
jgi:hypothetical protein